ncbi:MAG TPA: hypothetical protein VIM53_03125 [Candidatus Saccharimonadales bacterium]
MEPLPAPKAVVKELGPVVAVQLQGQTEWTTVATAIVAEGPHAAGDDATMPVIARSLRRLFGEHIGNAMRPVVDIEGRVPAVVHKGVLHPGVVNYVLHTDNLEHAAREYGEPGVLACLAVANSCELAGEDDGPIMLGLREEFGQATMEKYLTWRQVTNYSLVTPDDRSSLEAYVDQHVVRRYNTYFASALQDPNFAEFTLESAMAGIRDSLNTAGLELETAGDDAVKAHFEHHAVIDGATAAIKQGRGLTEVQRLVVAFNLLRDKAFMAKVMHGNAFMVAGPAHVDAIVAEWYRQRIIRREDYECYLQTVQRMGRTATAWMAHPSSASVSMVEVEASAIPERSTLTRLAPRAFTI